jgi:hypothetical protein
LLHILVSRDNVALSLHNTAQQDDRLLDEYRATVCRIEDNKQNCRETFISDVDDMNVFLITGAN